MNAQPVPYDELNCCYAGEFFPAWLTLQERRRLRREADQKVTDALRYCNARPPTPAARAVGALCVIDIPYGTIGSRTVSVVRPTLFTPCFNRDKLSLSPSGPEDPPSPTSAVPPPPNPDVRPPPGPEAPPSQKRDVPPAPKRDFQPPPERDDPPPRKRDVQPPRKRDVPPPRKRDVQPPPKRDVQPPPKRDVQPPPKRDVQPPPKRDDPPPRKRDDQTPPKRDVQPFPKRDVPPPRKRDVQPPPKRDNPPPRKRDVQPPPIPDALPPPKRDVPPAPVLEDHLTPKRDAPPAPRPLVVQLPRWPWTSPSPGDAVVQLSHRGPAVAALPPDTSVILTPDGFSIYVDHIPWVLTGGGSRQVINVYRDRVPPTRPIVVSSQRGG